MKTKFLVELFMLVCVIANTSTQPVEPGQSGPKVATHDVGRSARQAHPGRGWCLKCGMPWADSGMNAHEVAYGPADECCHGKHVYCCFFMCETCWQTSSLEERLESARALTRSWSSEPCSLENAFDYSVEISPEYEAKLQLLQTAIQDDWKLNHKGKSDEHDNLRPPGGQAKSAGRGGG